MSSQITTAFVRQYTDNVIHLCQQKKSKLRDAVRVETDVKDKTFFERIGATVAVEKTTRHGDTPLVEVPHSRRMVTLKDIEWADLVDKPDKIRLLINPESEYAINAAMAMNRKIDDIVIAAVLATAYTGVDGAGTQAWDSANCDVGSSSSNDGLTVAKMLSASTKLQKAEVDPDEEKFFVCGPTQIEDLLKNSTAPQISSFDYNTQKVLMTGKIDELCGFRFIISNRLPVDANDIRSCYAWVKSGMGLAIGQDIQSRITERADKSYSTQVYFAMSVGAVRIEEAKCVRIFCDETPD